MNKQRMINVQKLITGGGTEHERGNARSIFQKMLKSSGLTEDEFNNRFEQKEIYFFKFKDKLEKKLLVHIICKVLNSTDFDSYIKKGKRKVRGFELTKRQYIEVSEMYEIYRKALNDELDRLIHAFIIRNDIFPKNAGKNDEEFTPERLARLRKAEAMARNLDFIQIRKKLNEG